MQSKPLLHINYKAMHLSNVSFPNKGRCPLTKILLELIESFKSVSYTARISEDFDSRKYSQPTKFKQRRWILVNLRFKESCDSNLMVYILLMISPTHWMKNRRKNQKGQLQINEKLILEVIFVTFAENFHTLYLKHFGSVDDWSIWHDTFQDSVHRLRVFDYIRLFYRKLGALAYLNQLLDLFQYHQMK